MSANTTPTTKTGFTVLLQKRKSKVEKGKTEVTDVYAWLGKTYRGNILVENCSSLNNLKMNASHTVVLNQILAGE